jgi:hypothetical protein
VPEWDQAFYSDHPEIASRDRHFPGPICMLYRIGSELEADLAITSRGWLLAGRGRPRGKYLASTISRRRRLLSWASTFAGTTSRSSSAARRSGGTPPQCGTAGCGVTRAERLTAPHQ